MHTIVQLIQPILHHPFYTILIIWGVVKYKDLRQILCESDDRLSTRRVIAMLSANCLFNIASHCVNHGQIFDPYLGWTLVTTCLVCLGLVAISDIPKILDRLNSLKSGTTTKKTSSSTEEVKQVTTTE